MATPLTAGTIVTALRAEGCEVVEYRDWRTNNRNHKGPWGPVYGVMIHHTVTTGTDRSVALCYDGYSSLPGPLCHSVGAKDGRIFMVGHGRANHAGLGDDDVLRAVIAERSLPADNEANTDGNRHFYGIELINLGDGRDPWPEAQVDAAARWAAALCRGHGWNERSVIGHKEWQPGKIDPRFDMNAFRARVRNLLAARPGSPPPEEDNDVPDYLSIGRKQPFDLEPGRWTPVTWDTEWTDSGGVHAEGGQVFASGCSFVGDVNIRVRGLEAGKELQARLVYDREDGSRSDLPWDETPGTGGSTVLNTPITGRAARTTKVRVFVCHHGGGPVRVERVELKAQIWKS